MLNCRQGGRHQAPVCQGHCLPSPSQLTDHIQSCGRRIRMFQPLSLPDGTLFAGQDGNVWDKAGPWPGGPSRCPPHRLNQKGSFYGAHEDVGPSGRGHKPPRSGLVESTKTRHALISRSCVHTSKGRMRIQGHRCAVSYRAVNTTALQSRAGTAQDNGAASTRDKNCSNVLGHSSAVRSRKANSKTTCTEHSSERGSSQNQV